MGTLYDRTRWLIGEENQNLLKAARVIVFGVGGVGGYCVESFGRAGIGSITLVDFDVVDPTNINRQIIALRSTVNRPKVLVMEERLKDVNADINVEAIIKRVTDENIGEFQLEKYDYVIDAIDDVAGKIAIIKKAKEMGIPVISSMGTGNKIFGEKFQVTDISKSHTCPLAKVMRKELRKLGITHLKIVFSPEEPLRAEMPTETTKSPASISFIPPIAGLLIGGEVIRDIYMKVKNV